MNTVVLLGSTGQLGWELQRSLAPLGKVVALNRRGAQPAECGDLRNLDTLRASVRHHHPDVIVNAAAYTAVDKAESEAGLARAVNALAPQALAQVAQEAGALLVHYSSDYVFDGSGAAPRREDAPTRPLNVYGETKLEGERLIAQACSRHLILRTSWVYAARGNNFPKTMLKLAQEREALSVVDDQWGAPTGAELIADVSAHAIRQALSQPALCGTYHLCAAGETNWHGYTRFVLDCARELDPSLSIKAQELRAVASSAFPTPAQRPLNSRLDSSRLREAFGLALPPWQVGVKRMLAEILCGGDNA